MIQRHFPELCPTCLDSCDDICRGDCGCEACRDCFDDPVWIPEYHRCPKCGEVVAIVYGPDDDGEHQVDFPISDNGPKVHGNRRRAKCCEKEYMRLRVEGVFVKGSEG